jgi:hypothetical protein
MFSCLALRLIEKGEELLISYTTKEKSRKAAHERLRNQYGFDCQCASQPPPNTKISEKKKI